MWNRVELKEDSKVLLKLNYWPFVLVAFIHMLVAGSASGGVSYQRLLKSTGNDIDIDSGIYFNYYNLAEYAVALLAAALVGMLGFAAAIFILTIFVFHPLEVGCKRYMTIARDVKPAFGELGFVFRNCYGNVVKIMFLKNLYIFLWTLLLIIPGIVKTYEYRMVPYLLAEYPDMDAPEAFRISREMMTGNKWEAFVLDLSFLGWNILSLMTVGIVGFFYAEPYQMLTNSALYLRLKMTNPTFGYAKPDDNYYV